jgi:hypothetical protein
MDGSSYFIILNTDYACAKDGGDMQCGVANMPIHWVTTEIAHAQNDKRIEHIFLLGHKPPFAVEGLYFYPQDYIGGLHPDSRDPIWKALSATTKGVGFFVAHSHAYNASQPTLLASDTPDKWQVIAGNGGSPLDSGWSTDLTFQTNNYFGFSVVKIYKSGRVRTISYGRGYGPDYLSPSDAKKYPTSARAAFDLVLTKVP